MATRARDDRESEPPEESSRGAAPERTTGSQPPSERRPRRRSATSDSATNASGEEPSGSAEPPGPSVREARGGASRRQQTGRASSAASRRQETDRASGPQRRSLAAGKAARLAMQQVSELTNRAPESVTSLESTEQGWRVGVEVVESHRIPDSTDILAVYEAELDGDGELVSYRRRQRYYRGRAQED